MTTIIAQRNLTAERAGMTMSRPELVKATGLLGILNTPAERISFAAGNIPPALRTMLDSLPSEVAEEAEIILLTGIDFPRVSNLWDVTIAEGVLTDATLDSVYKQIIANRG